MENISIHKEILEEYVHTFHKMGFCCSLDDFDNGFFNYDLLKERRLDAIKTDYCFFVEEMSETNKEILKTVIHLIKNIGKWSLQKALRGKRMLNT